MNHGVLRARRMRAVQYNGSKIKRPCDIPDLHCQCKIIIISRCFGIYADVRLFFVSSCSHHAQPQRGHAKKKTLAKRNGGGREKKMIYSFVSDSSTKNKLKGKKIRMEEKRRRKKNVCWTCSTSGWERSAICACALNTEQCVYRAHAHTHTRLRGMHVHYLFSWSEVSIQSTVRLVNEAINVHLMKPSCLFCSNSSGICFSASARWTWRVTTPDGMFHVSPGYIFHVRLGKTETIDGPFLKITWTVTGWTFWHSKRSSY